jgi:uncharacterized protein YyaL (SSP411 family)
MLVAADGSLGVYERYRIDKQQVNYWVRPDCTMEVARFFYAYGQHIQDQTYMAIALRMAGYVLSQQRNDGWFEGSFAFYRFIPPSTDVTDIGSPEAQEVTFPNDNGKIADRLIWFYKQTGDETYKQAAVRLLNYFLRAQADDGTFSRNDEGDQPALKGVDFVAWPTLAMMQGAWQTSSETYRMAAFKGIDWMSKQITPSGRIRTSFETAQTEAWRPPSSETAVALKAFAVVARFSQNLGAWNGLMTLAKALIRLQDKTGAIRDCDDDSRDASLQNDPDLTDMVYTNGYALLAFEEAYRSNGLMDFRVASEKLADFLADVQCWGESGKWDGSWRGSYSLKSKRWHGRANQGNDLDEGGMYSAYTGWSTAPIAYGLLRVVTRIVKK